MQQSKAIQVIVTGNAVNNNSSQQQLFNALTNKAETNTLPIDSRIIFNNSGRFIYHMGNIKQSDETVANLVNNKLKDADDIIVVFDDVNQQRATQLITKVQQQRQLAPNSKIIPVLITDLKEDAGALQQQLNEQTADWSPLITAANEQQAKQPIESTILNKPLVTATAAQQAQQQEPTPHTIITTPAPKPPAAAKSSQSSWIVRFFAMLWRGITSIFSKPSLPKQHSATTESSQTTHKKQITVVGDNTTEVPAATFQPQAAQPQDKKPAASIKKAGQGGQEDIPKTPEYNPFDRHIPR